MQAKDKGPKKGEPQDEPRDKPKLKLKKKTLKDLAAPEAGAEGVQGGGRDNYTQGCMSV